MTSARQFLLIAALGFFVAVLSAVIVRDHLGIVGNLCEKSEQNPLGHCYEQLPAAGFPFRFLLDDGEVSVVSQLGPEDDIRVFAFLGNWLLYTAVVALGLAFSRKRSSQI